MAGHMVNSPTVFEDATAVCSGVISSDIAHWQCVSSHSACAISSDLCVGSNFFPHNASDFEVSFSNYSRWRPPPSSNFKISKFYGPNSQEGETLSPCQISWRPVKRLQKYDNFFDFSIWRPPRCWICKFSKFWPCHRTEVRGHLSSCCWDMAIYPFLNMDFKFSKFYLSERSIQWNCVAKPNFVAIDQTIAQIWRFFDFYRWWLFDFYRWWLSAILDMWCAGLGYQRGDFVVFVTVQNLVRIDTIVSIIRKFLCFAS